MPVTNATDVTVPPPYSYLVKFGEDVKYDGEYDTFHVLRAKVMTDGELQAIQAKFNPHCRVAPIGWQEFIFSPPPRGPFSRSFPRQASGGWPGIKV